MAKRSKESRHAAKMRQLANRAPGQSVNEGKFQIKFTFDGKEYTRAHQATPFEVEKMKELIREHGDVAADQLVWRMFARGVTLMAEAVVGQAGKEYLEANWKPKAGTTEEHPSNPVANTPNQEVPQ